MSDEDLRSAERIAAASGGAEAGERAFAEHIRQGHLGLAAEMVIRYPEQSARALAGLVPGDLLQRFARSLQVAPELNHVRVRPAMYIGSVGSRGLFALFEEVLDSALARTFDMDARVAVTLSGDHVTIEDDGYALPTDVVEHASNVPVPVFATQLQDVAVVREPWYPVLGGLHGVGLAVVNALCSQFVVQIRTEGATHAQSFARGIPLTSVDVQPSSEARAQVRIEFSPDRTIFHPPAALEAEPIRQRLRELSYLRPRLRFFFSTATIGEEEIHDQRGLRGWVEDNFPRRLASPPFECFGVHSHPELGPVHVAAALTYQGGAEERLATWANLVPMVEGGTPISGLRAASQAAGTRWLGRRSRESKHADFTRGLAGAVSVLLARPVFGGPQRSSVVNPELAEIVQGLVEPQLHEWLLRLPEREATAIRGQILARSSPRRPPRGDRST